MTVIIGIDPHKASHTAVAIGCDEQQLAEIRVRATCQQTERLLAWAEPLGERTWAVESAGGHGLPVVPTARRSRRAGPRCAGDAGLEGAGARHRAVQQERPQRCAVGGHRRPPLSGTPFGRASQPPRGAPPPGQAEPRDREAPQHRRVPAPCRPGQPLTGGISKELNASDAMRLLNDFEPITAVEQTRYDLAHELLDDVERLDVQLKESHRRIKDGGRRRREPRSPSSMASVPSWPAN